MGVLNVDDDIDQIEFILGKERRREKKKKKKKRRREKKKKKETRERKESSERKTGKKGEVGVIDTYSRLRAVMVGNLSVHSRWRIPFPISDFWFPESSRGGHTIRSTIRKSFPSRFNHLRFFFHFFLPSYLFYIISYYLLSLPSRTLFHSNSNYTIKIKCCY